VSWGVGALIVLMAVGVYSWTSSAVFTALAMIILVGSLAGFFFPTVYKFYEGHVEVRYTVSSVKREWSQFRSFYPDRNGVLLSPFATPSRLENFRGVYLRFGRCERSRVLEIIKSKIENRKDEL
jgi:hypothetical protein